MSLKAYIRDRKSPIAEFLRSQFPNDRSFLADARKQVRQAATIRPVADVRWDIIGMAFDYRLRYYFEVIPFEELVAYKGACLIKDSGAMPLLGELDFHWNGRKSDAIQIFDKASGKLVFSYYPDRHGGWGDGGSSDELRAKAFQLGEKVALGEIAQQESSAFPLRSDLRAFGESLKGLTDTNPPVATKLPRSLEDELNRHCVVLALLEEAFRTHYIHDEFVNDTSGNADVLLGIADTHWIDDMRDLSWTFYDKYAHLALRQTVLNPTFEGSRDVGGADADLIIDGTLIEIKCTIKDEIQADWLRQLLGYVLLDYSDKLGITGLGFYMARQGLLLQWDLDEVLGKLCQGKPPAIAELRNRFREINRKPTLEARTCGSACTKVKLGTL